MTLAFVFPGHGSHMVGMLNSLSNLREVKETIQEASDVLDEDIGKLITEGPKEALAVLSNAAPAMVTAGVACYRAWIAAGGPKPNIVAGHSHGEYSALVAAETISFKDAISIVRFRANAMQTVSGRMAAIIGLGASKVVELCLVVSSNTGKVVEAVNFNAPGQILISGDKEAVDIACDIFREAGAKLVIPLAITVPAHSSLMKPVSENLQDYFNSIEFRSPVIPVINNVDVSIVNDPHDIKSAMVRHVANPVRWQEVIKTMSARGIKHVVECGPGEVLHELVPRIDSKLQGLSFIDEPSLVEVIQTLS